MYKSVEGTLAEYGEYAKALLEQYGSNIAPILGAIGEMRLDIWWAVILTSKSND